MKTLKIFAVLAIAGGLTSSSLFAQPDGHGPGKHEGGPGRPSPERMIKGVVKQYETVAAYDANKDGQLDDAEKAALSQAMTDGKIEMPKGPRPGGDGEHKPDPAKFATHAAELYASVAPFDANKDGQIDETEQTALQQAIKDGTVKLPKPGFGGHRPPPDGKGPDNAP